MEKLVSQIRVFCEIKTKLDKENIDCAYLISYKINEM